MNQIIRKSISIITVLMCLVICALPCYAATVGKDVAKDGLYEWIGGDSNGWKTSGNYTWSGGRYVWDAEYADAAGRVRNYSAGDSDRVYGNARWKKGSVYYGDGVRTYGSNSDTIYDYANYTVDYLTSLISYTAYFNYGTVAE